MAYFDNVMTLFDGPHEYTHVSSYAFLVGSLFGGGLVLAWTWCEHFEFGLYVAMLGLFHQLEYFQTALFNASKLSLDCNDATSWFVSHAKPYV